RGWEAATGAEAHRLTGHPSGASSLAFAPPGRSLVTTGWGRSFRLLDVATGQPVQSFGPHGEDVRRVAFAPDGTAVASSSEDGTVRLWQVSSGKELRRFSAPDGAGPIAFSPDGRTLAAGAGATLLLSDVGALLRAPPPPP